jgi:putative transposase
MTTIAPAVLEGHDGFVEDHDPAARPRRRTFTAAYKSEILDRCDSLPKGSPERGALLRREGLYSSHVAEWRKQRDAGAEAGLSPRGSVGKRAKSPEQKELEVLRGAPPRWSRSWRRRGWRWRSREKHTRSWSCSPRARSRTSGRRSDRHRVHRARPGHLDGAGVRAAGPPRATHYRRQAPPRLGPAPPRPAPPNKLTEAERQHILTLLRSPRYCDLAPAQVWARLLDEGVYLCSISTMYRLLATAGQSRERRRQRTHPAKKKPELIATAPNQVWSWDITKLPGPTRGVYYELFVIIDIYSRCVLGWTVAAVQTGELAEAFIAETLAAQGVERDQLTRHADRGTSMTSKPVAQLLVDLGVARSHSRPHVSNDNPFSEAAVQDPEVLPGVPVPVRLDR